MDEMAQLPAERRDASTGAEERNSTSRLAPEAPAREGRKPRISQIPPAAPPAARLADYEPIIGKSQLDEVRFVASPLRGRRVKMVNSTAVGGGVAEMLNRLVPLLDELDVQTGWEG